MQTPTNEQILAHLNNIAISVNQMRGTFDELNAVRLSYQVIKQIVDEKITNNTDSANSLQGTQGFKAETDSRP